jgi:oxygen-independent coproporphyrinogen-3 oxidase
MDPALIDRYSAPVPRYTSYPTAPHFHAGVDAAVYGGWLGEIASSESVSLYLHVPFCDRLCWFCGCHTKQVRRYDPIAEYLEALRLEIGLVGGRLGRKRISAVHFGGGSPTLMQPDDVRGLGALLRETFELQPDCEISVECDPNDMDEPRLDAWRDFGVTRASFGVQDFDPVVQRAINRIQTFEQTRDAVEGFRARGVGSINLDVLYGLPHQTVDALRRTLEQAVSLAPDRLALFGYAHVPWMKKHQQMIDEAVLPGRHQRFEQAERGADFLERAGYVRIGLDHFARPGDKLAVAAAEGRLHRNFQGYTTDAASVLVGLGASSISRLPQGYVQNIVATGQYMACVRKGELSAAKGYAFTPIDRATGWAIEQLMCNFEIALPQLDAEFPSDAESVAERIRDIAADDPDGLVRFDGRAIALTPQGRPFVRTVAAKLDRFLTQGGAKYSAAV